MQHRTQQCPRRLPEHRVGRARVRPDQRIYVEPDLRTARGRFTKDAKKPRFSAWTLPIAARPTAAYPPRALARTNTGVTSHDALHHKPERSSPHRIACRGLRDGGVIGLRVAEALPPLVEPRAEPSPTMKIVSGHFPKSATPMRADQAQDCQNRGGIPVTSARPNEYLCLVR